MTTKTAKSVRSRFPVAAIVSLDPAGVGPAGLAIRTTASLDKPVRGKMRAPDFVYEGLIFEPNFHDELSEYLARKCGRGQRALLVVENAIYNSRTIARHIGRCIGCVESILVDLNLAQADDTRYVAPVSWRAVAMPLGNAGEGRDGWKETAVRTVKNLYQLDVNDNAAEAILINDFTVLKRQQWWKEGKQR